MNDETPAIDAAHIERQRAFSLRTFGPGARTGMVLDHIRKETDEIEAAPDDLEEWADLMLLALDGAWRAGHQPQAIIDAIIAKQARNEARSWPDWRTTDPDRAIEHVREPEDASTFMPMNGTLWVSDGGPWRLVGPFTDGRMEATE